VRALLRGLTALHHQFGQPLRRHVHAFARAARLRTSTAAPQINVQASAAFVLVHSPHRLMRGTGSAYLDKPRQLLHKLRVLCPCPPRVKVLSEVSHARFLTLRPVFQCEQMCPLS
jgi:hypothetical protein